MRVILLTVLVLLECFAFVSSKGAVCGDDWCICFRSNRTANCRYHGKNLTYIPPLPGYIKVLRFQDNYLPSVDQGSFENISHLQLQYLNLDFNNISFISKNAFSIFNHLITLYLNSNQIATEMLFECLGSLKTESLSTLSIQDLNIGKTDMMASLHLPKLDALLLDQNNLKVYNHSHFKHFRKLRFLSLRNNKIEIVFLTYARRLGILGLRNNMLKEIPNFCNDHGTYFPNLHTIDFDHNSFITNICKQHLICLICLKQISLDSSSIQRIKQNTFNGFPVLQNLHLSDMNFIQHIESYAFNNSNIVSISISNCDIDITTHMDPSAFRGCSRLKSLRLSGNDLRQASEEELDKMFGFLTSLTSIYLLRTGLKRFPKFIPQRLINLDSIGISNNDISNFDVNTFTSLLKLKRLWASGNKFTKVDEEIFPLDMRRRLEVIDLSSNPFNCDCDLRWFIDFLKQEPPNKLREYPDKYTCASPRQFIGLKLSTVHFTEEMCRLSLFTSLIIIGSLSVVMSVVLVLSLSYRWRWHIRLYIYRKRHVRKTNNQIVNDEKIYDAYVIYTQSDIRWIKSELIPEIEEESNKKLYIRDRDSMPGLPAVDNVVDNMATSRCALVVLSKAMASNEECQFELMYVQRQEEEHRVPILLVLLEEIQTVSQCVYALVTTNSYISWGDDRQARNLFWERLRHSLDTLRAE